MTEQLFQSIRGVVFDCDGVLSEGSLDYNQSGVRTLSFYARDGLGLALLKKVGINMAILSGRAIDIARHRHQELGIDPMIGPCRDKAKGVAEVAAQWGLTLDALAYVGDDLIDLPAMVRVGLPIAVADAHEVVQGAARWVTPRKGGRGAVRDVCERLLKEQGHWDGIIAGLMGTGDA